MARSEPALHWCAPVDLRRVLAVLWATSSGGVIVSVASRVARGRLSDPCGCTLTARRLIQPPGQGARTQSGPGSRGSPLELLGAAAGDRLLLLDPLGSSDVGLLPLRLEALWAPDMATSPPQSEGLRVPAQCLEPKWLRMHRLCVCCVDMARSSMTLLERESLCRCVVDDSVAITVLVLLL